MRHIPERRAAIFISRRLNGTSAETTPVTKAVSAFDAVATPAVSLSVARTNKQTYPFPDMLNSRPGGKLPPLRQGGPDEDARVGIEIRPDILELRDQELPVSLEEALP